MKHGIAIRALYFFFYGAVGVHVAFFSRYLLGLGFSGDELGLVQMVSPVAGTASAVMWSAAADRLGAKARVLKWCGLAALVPFLALPFAKTPVAAALVLLFHELSAPAIVPLLDAVTFEWLRSRGSGSYARVRLFGTLGFVVASQLAGVVLDARGNRAGDVAVPMAILVCVAGYAITGFLLPNGDRPSEQPNLRDAGVVLRDPRLRMLVVISALHWLSSAPYDLLFGVYLGESGVPARSVGLLYGAGTLAELAIFSIFPRLHRSFDTRILLALAFGSTALRWYLLSEARTLLFIGGVQLLHGLGFGLFWCSAVEIIGEVVPARLRASGHALFSALVVGFGNALGYRLSGLGLDAFGGTRPLFATAALVELAPLGLLLVFGARLVVSAPSRNPG